MKESLAARQAALLRQNAELDQKVEAIEQRRQQQQQLLLSAKSSPGSTPDLSKKHHELSASEPLVVLSDSDNTGGLFDDDSDAMSSPERGVPVPSRRGLTVDLSASIDSATEKTTQDPQQSATETNSRSAHRRKSQLRQKKSTGNEPSATTAASAHKSLRCLQSEQDGDAGAKLEANPEQPSPDAKPQQAASSDGDGDGLGLEATVRYQKARLRVLQDELEGAHSEAKELQSALQQSKSKIEELTSESGSLKKKQQQTQQLLEKQQELSAAQESKQKILETQLSAAQAKIEEIQRAEKQASQQFRSKDVRLNRALEELEKTKAQLQEERRAQGEQTVSKSEYEHVLKENKRLEKQKNELLVAFKKQMKLIDLLKRQRIHMEAAKMLSFTEEEFSKTLELG